MMMPLSVFLVFFLTANQQAQGAYAVRDVT